MAIKLEEIVIEFLEAELVSQCKLTFQPLQNEILRQGVDPRAFAEPLLNISSQADSLANEIQRVKQSVVTRSFMILAACIALRFFISGQAESYGVDWLELFIVAVSLILGISLQYFHLRTLPGIWTHEVSQKDVTPQFIAWCELVIADEILAKRPESAACKTWSETLEKISLSRRREMRDGVCRRSQRVLNLNSWAFAELSNSRRKLQQVIMFMPISELLLATVLGVGLCALPAINFMNKDLVSDN